MQKHILAVLVFFIFVACKKKENNFVENLTDNSIKKWYEVPSYRFRKGDTCGPYYTYYLFTIYGDMKTYVRSYYEDPWGRIKMDCMIYPEKWQLKSDTTIVLQYGFYTIKKLTQDSFISISSKKDTLVLVAAKDQDYPKN